jgi:hypothetical protein
MSNSVGCLRLHATKYLETLRSGYLWECFDLETACATWKEQNLGDNSLCLEFVDYQTQLISVAK